MSVRARRATRGARRYVVLIALAAVLVLASGVAGADSLTPGGRPWTGALLVEHVQRDGERETSSVHLLDVDGSVHVVAPGPADASPAWSPDGARIAFRRGDELWVGGRDGEDARQVAAGVSDVGPEAWSPDGTALAVVASGALVVVDADSGAVAPLVDAALQPSAAAWSPDGGRIAFRRGDVRAAAAVDVATGAVEDLAADVVVEDPGAAITWAPAADAVAVVGRSLEPRYPDDPGPPTVWILRPDGSGVERRLGDGHTLPAWSPDSARIAVVQPSDAGDVVEVYERGSYDAPAQLVVEGDVASLAWDPAGDRLIAAVEGSAPVRGVVLLDMFEGDIDVVAAVGRDDGVRAVVAPLATPVPERSPVADALWWSRRAPDGGAGTVLLGRADDFADSLASGGLQGALDAPLLLTATDGLDATVADELARLGAERVVLLGGEEALARGVADDLEGRGYVVERVQGRTRIETAVAVARRGFTAPTTVLVARAFGDPEAPDRAFADALGGASLAAAMPAPLLLTGTDELAAALAEYVETTPTVEEAIVLGGPAAVSDAVVAELAQLGVSVRRVSGPERFSTAARLTAFAAEVPGPGGRFVVLDGTRPDAWASGFSAARWAGPLSGGGVLLLQGDVVPSSTLERLGQVHGGETSVTCAPHVAAATCDRVADDAGALAAHRAPTYVSDIGPDASGGWLVARGGCLHGSVDAPGAAGVYVDVDRNGGAETLLAPVTAAGVVLTCGVNPVPSRCVPLPSGRCEVMTSQPEDIVLEVLDGGGQRLASGSWRIANGWSYTARVVDDAGALVATGLLVRTQTTTGAFPWTCLGLRSLADDVRVVGAVLVDERSSELARYTLDAPARSAGACVNGHEVDAGAIAGLRVATEVGELEGTLLRLDVAPEG